MARLRLRLALTALVAFVTTSAFGQLIPSIPNTYGDPGAWQGVHQLAESGSPVSMDFDANGNVYVVGTFNAGLRFNNSSINLSNPNGVNNVFLLKLAPNTFTPIWAEVAASNGNDNVRQVLVDDVNGYVYVLGTFEDTIDFGTQISQRVSQGNRDIFIAKYNTSGDVIWTRSIGGNGEEMAGQLAFDNNGDLIVVGAYNSSATFFGTSAATNRSVSSAKGGSDVFVGKLTPNGDWTWAERFGTSLNDAATSVATDGQGNVYVTGYLTFDFATASNNLLTFSNVTANRNAATGLPNNVAVDELRDGIVANHTVNNTQGFVARFSPSGTMDRLAQFGSIDDNDWGNAVIYNAGRSEVYVKTTFGVGSADQSFGGNPAQARFNNGTPTFKNIVLNGTDPEAVTLAYNDTLAILNPTSVALATNNYNGAPNTDNTRGMDIQLDGGGDIVKLEKTWVGDDSTQGARFLISKVDPAQFLATTAQLEWNKDLDLNPNVMAANTSIMAVDMNIDNEKAVYILGSAPTGNFVTNYALFGDDTLKSAGIFISKLSDRINATSPVVEQNFICGGLDTLQVDYEIDQNFNSGNSFSVVLSDSSGSFDNAQTIGSISSRNATTDITITIPENLDRAGTYRIRVQSTNPAFISNAFNLATFDTVGGNDRPVMLLDKPGFFATPDPDNAPVVFCEGGNVDLRLGMVAKESSIGTDTVALISPTLNAVPQNLDIDLNNDATTDLRYNIQSIGWTGGSSSGSTTNRTTQATASGAYSAVVQYGLPTSGAGFIAYSSSSINYCEATASSISVTEITANTQFSITAEGFINNQPKICEGETVVLDAGPGFNSYTWNPGGQTTRKITVSAAGDYSVAVTSICNADTINSLPITVQTLPLPNKPIIDTSTGVLRTNPAAFIQWRLNGVNIPGATGTVHYPTTSGTYTVQITDLSGCSNVSDTVCVGPCATGINDRNGLDNLTAYPNPTNGLVNVQAAFNGSKAITLRVFSYTGTVVGTLDLGQVANGFQTEVDLSELTNGVYLLQVADNEGNSRTLRVLKR